jgi:hypothetical protein
MTRKLKYINKILTPALHKIPCGSNLRTNQLLSCRETRFIYCGNHMEYKNVLCVKIQGSLLLRIAGGVYSVVTTKLYTIKC